MYCYEDVSDIYEYKKNPTASPRQNIEHKQYRLGAAQGEEAVGDAYEGLSVEDQPRGGKCEGEGDCFQSLNRSKRVPIHVVVGAEARGS